MRKDANVLPQGTRERPRPWHGFGRKLKECFYIILFLRQKNQSIT